MSRERLLRQFGRMERDRQDILKRLEGARTKRLATSPGEHAWYIAQVITHLAIAEEGGLTYLNKKLEVKKHGPVGISSHWRLFLLNIAVWLPIKYKAPAIVADVPATSYEVARQRWSAVRERMREAYTTIDTSFIGHDLYKHPMAGRFNLIQGVRFMRRHVQHHKAQIHRTLRQV